MALPAETLRLLAEKTSSQVLRDRYFGWLLICTGAVAIGVIMEEVGELDFKKRGILLAVKLARFQIEIPAYRLKAWLRRIVRAGWLLVVVGVIGEGLFEGFVSREDGHLQSIDGSLLSVAQQQASDIGDHADRLAKLLEIEEGIVARLQRDEKGTEARLSSATSDLTEAQWRMDLDIRRRGPRAKLLFDANIRLDPRLAPIPHRRQQVLILTCIPRDTETEEAAVRLGEELSARGWLDQVDRIECPATIGILSPTIVVSPRADDICHANAEALSEVLIDALLLRSLVSRSLVVIGEHPKSPSDPNTIIVQMNLHADR